MVAKNDITGDSIQSRKNNKAYEDNFDRIFGKKKEDDKNLAEYELNKSTGEVQRVDDEKKEVKIKATIKDVKIKGSL